MGAIYHDASFGSFFAANEMSDSPPPNAEFPEGAGKVDESTLVPVERDRGFVVRLVSLLLVGLIAAVWVGAKLQHAAGDCGAGLIRPGSSVIPPERQAH